MRTITLMGTAEVRGKERQAAIRVRTTGERQARRLARELGIKSRGKWWLSKSGLICRTDRFGTHIEGTYTTL